MIFKYVRTCVSSLAQSQLLMQSGKQAPTCSFFLSFWLCDAQIQMFKKQLKQGKVLFEVISLPSWLFAAVPSICDINTLRIIGVWPEKGWASQLGYTFRSTNTPVIPSVDRHFQSTDNKWEPPTTNILSNLWKYSVCKDVKICLLHFIPECKELF